MRSCSTTALLLFWWLLLSLSLWTSDALGGSNVFGLFRKRRMQLLDEQMEREDQAARKGFAGPHGEPLSGDEMVEVLQEQQQQGWGMLDPLRGWFQNSKENDSHDLH